MNRIQELQLIIVGVFLLMCYTIVPALTENITQEQTIKGRIEALTETKAAFAIDVNNILVNVAEPTIAAVEAMITEAQAIHDMTVDYAADCNADPNETMRALGVVDAFCDSNSIQQKKQTLFLLKAIIKISKEEFTK